MRFTALVVVASVALAPLLAVAHEPPESASALSRAVATAQNRQPSIPRPEQDAAAAEKLAAFAARSGQKPNIFMADDMGYGDPGASKLPYKESIVEVDAHIGAIVDALEAAGELDTTFIFVTSDNGPQMDGWPDSGYTPFRGAKGTTWEGGVRVPGIAYWRGMIEPGRVSDGVFDLLDRFDTALALGGVDTAVLPQDRYWDGIDQTSFLIVEDGQSKREHIHNWLGSTLAAMRMREFRAYAATFVQFPPKHLGLGK